MIKELWEAGSKKRLERKIARVCFHVLAINLVIKHIDAETSFMHPVTSAHLDWYFGMDAWNNWFFNKFLTKPELDPKRLVHYKGDGCAKDAA